CQSYITSPFTF
nr:immunoglobulin light chain junction region [Macaca mulatta]MOV74257.1 immunoglobulin light chain junction region [Macaca mulatta]MOV74313.1 immunoglobulin light chain junction region [Macaca mulatta]MOV74333.1 immunoglobulin light chain junction region [Macaca mulatta]MOV74405.1 immunoglobulin light chain junction region [Macaca mulatta]